MGVLQHQATYIQSFSSRVTAYVFVSFSEVSNQECTVSIAKALWDPYMVI